MLSKDLMGEGMEGAGVEGERADEAMDAVDHLVGGGTAEADEENGCGRDAVMLDQVRNTRRDRRRLPRSGGRQNALVLVGGRADDGVLLFIQCHGALGKRKRVHDGFSVWWCSGFMLSRLYRLYRLYWMRSNPCPDLRGRRQMTEAVAEAVTDAAWYDVIRQGVKRSGIEGLAFQNHLYACFLLMEDLSQGLLESKDGVVTGNGLSLNLETQFGQIGVRYYGFVMDGQAVLRTWPAAYKEGWMRVWSSVAVAPKAAAGVAASVAASADAIEDALLAVIQEEPDSWFMNAMEHQGSLSADRVEQALYLLHPDWETKKVEKPTATATPTPTVEKRRRLAVTRRQQKASKGRGTRLRRKNTNPMAQ